SFRNTSDAPARLLCLCSPSGQEELFMAVGDPVDSAAGPVPVLSEAEKGERREKAAALMPQYRTEMVQP
ncbi:MAG TPA: hypothetical protein VFY65_07500, partial [Longimicrobium sp.]|nr:hypothetical protein [Longimicrobium sp.]